MWRHLVWHSPLTFFLLSEWQWLWEMTNLCLPLSQVRLFMYSLRVQINVYVTIAIFQTRWIYSYHLGEWEDQKKKYRVSQMTGYQFKAMSKTGGGGGQEHLLVSGRADVDAPWVTSWFEFTCQGDIISKQAISWHSYPNNASKHRAWVNAYPHLKEKERKMKRIYLCFSFGMQFF